MRLIGNSANLTSPSIQLPHIGTSQSLILSMRQVSDSVGYCFRYEFENLVAEMIGADVAYVNNLDGLDLSRQVYKAVRLLTGSRRLAETARPGLGAVSMKKPYDFFLAFVNHPHELHALHAIEGWRERTRFAACYLGEAYTGDLPRYLIELLHRFDHIFVGVSGSVEAISKICDRPCSYLPIGVDALAFSPGHHPPGRTIDITSIGRRSGVTHEALLRYADEHEHFYHYDTIKSGGRSPISFRVTSFVEHRKLLANLLKRSRYFIANRAWVDNPALTGGREEIPGRFYEGAAAGTVMLGVPPDTADFRAQFGWPDAIVPTAFDEPAIGRIIARLDADPERVERARVQNVVNALLGFDWVYRIRSMIEVAGVPVSEAMHRRIRALRQRADDVRSGLVPARLAL